MRFFAAGFFRLWGTGLHSRYGGLCARTIWIALVCRNPQRQLWRICLWSAVSAWKRSRSVSADTKAEEKQKPLQRFPECEQRPRCRPAPLALICNTRNATYYPLIEPTCAFDAKIGGGFQAALVVTACTGKSKKILNLSDFYFQLPAQVIEEFADFGFCYFASGV